MENKKIAVIGGTSWDTIVHLYSPLKGGPQTTWARDCYQAIGGTGAGKSLNLAALGCSVFCHTVLGEDQQKEQVLQELRSQNIDVFAQITEMPTEQHTNLMSGEGDRVSIYTHGPSNPDNLDLSAIKKAFSAADVAVISIVEYAKKTLKLAQEYELPIWIDLHDYDGKNPYHQEFIDAADVLFVSSEKLSKPKEFMLSEIKKGKELVVCTFGKGGSIALDNNLNWYEYGIIHCPLEVDSNGAGDAYFSGFLVAKLKGMDIESCMLAGAIVASLCVASKKLFHHELDHQTLDVVWSTSSEGCEV